MGKISAAVIAAVLASATLTSAAYAQARTTGMQPTIVADASSSTMTPAQKKAAAAKKASMAKKSKMSNAMSSTNPSANGGRQGTTAMKTDNSSNRGLTSNPAGAPMSAVNPNKNGGNQGAPTGGSGQTTLQSSSGD